MIIYIILLLVVGVGKKLYSILATILQTCLRPPCQSMPFCRLEEADSSAPPARTNRQPLQRRPSSPHHWSGTNTASPTMSRSSFAASSPSVNDDSHHLSLHLPSTPFSVARLPNRYDCRHHDFTRTRSGVMSAPSGCKVGNIDAKTLDAAAGSVAPR